ncbi:MAG: aldo/keto reductase [Lachnospiraceae bacterium]|nr:aldo/keto reductase [Lachnospiraceae bacterium]
MQYRKDRKGNDISILGYGCMRFTQNMGNIDIKKAEKEVLAAIDRGVTYFDTAYVYPGSEDALGRILDKNGVRDKIRIATKLPHYLMKSREDAQKCFEEELRRLRTDYVDYYLMHMLTDIATWNRLVDLGIRDWIEEKLESGQIRQIGFSYHGNSDSFIELLNAYDWDFCQIQYNYLDETSQAGVAGLKAAADKGLPVIIMEPLRGGRLVDKLPSKAREMIDAHSSGRTPAEWAFRWLWDQPEVTCVLSGMNSLEMVEENTKTADESVVGCMTEEDKEFIAKVRDTINASVKVGCTGCRYCMPCPKSVDIPGVFAAYNRRFTDSYFSAFKDYIMCTALRKNSTAASNCVKCGKCETHCPQGINIRDELENAKRTFEGPIYKVSTFFMKRFMKY